MSSIWDSAGFTPEDMDTAYPEQFKAALQTVLEQDFQGKKGKAREETKAGQNKSSALTKTNQLLEETKALGVDVDSDDMYEGGDSDEEQERKKVCFRLLIVMSSFADTGAFI